MALLSCCSSLEAELRPAGRCMCREVGVQPNQTQRLTDCLHERAQPPVSCKGPQTSYFQNDLRHFQAKVAKVYMTNSTLTALLPWVGSDLLTSAMYSRVGRWDARHFGF